MKQIRFHTKHRKERRTKKVELRGRKCGGWRAKVSETQPERSWGLKIKMFGEVWRCRMKKVNMFGGVKIEQMEQRVRGKFKRTTAARFLLLFHPPKMVRSLFVTFQSFKWIKSWLPVEGPLPPLKVRCADFKVPRGSCGGTRRTTRTA